MPDEVCGFSDWNGDFTVTWQSDTCPLLKQNICSLVIVLYNAFVLDTSDFTLPEVTHWHFIEVFSRTRKW